MTTSVRDLQGIIVNSIGKINRKHNLMEQQLNRYMGTCLLWLQEFFNIFPVEKYIAISGPIRPRVVIEKTPITLRVSGIFRSNVRQTIHAIAFTPGATDHYIKNDPVTHLILKTLKPLVKQHLQSNRPQVIIHSFGYGKNHNLNYHTLSSEKIDEGKVQRLENLIRAMEIGYHFPVLPCLHKCPFKKDCY